MESRELRADDFKRLAWRSIGPAIMGGRVASIAAAPGDPKTFYVGYASGGIWKTTNLGVTFSPIFDKEETSSIGSIAVCDAPASWAGWTPADRKKPKQELIAEGKGKIVWVGTGEGNGRNSSSWGHGVYRSTDAGKTWKHLGLEATHDIPVVAPDPRDPDVCYVAALGRLWGHNEERGVYKTTDGGTTWTKVLYLDEKTGCCDLVLDPTQPDTLFAAMYQRLRKPWSMQSGGDQGGIYKSTDGGATWRKLEQGLPALTGRIGLDAFRKDGKRLYAVIESHEGGVSSIRDDRSKSGGVFASSDGGETWERRSVRAPRAFYFSGIWADPIDPEKVYMLGWHVEVSEDGGRTFRGQLQRRAHVDMHALVVDPEDPKHLILGSDGGVYQTFDGGEAWQFLNTMATGQFYNIGLEPRVPYRVIGGLQDNGTWVGPSETNKETGENDPFVMNTGMTNADWEHVFGGDGFHAEFDPSDPDTVYAEWQGGNLYRINLKAARAKYIAPQQREGGPRFRFNWNSPFLISAHDPSVIYHGGNHVFRLTERGDKWDKISPDLTTQDLSKMETIGSNAETYGTVVSLAESALGQGLLWAGTDDGLVWVTEDDGANWRNVTPPQLEGRYVSRIEASRFERGRAYVAVDGHRTDDYEPHLLVTEDLGVTWNDITSDLPSGRSVVVVREHAKHPDVLMVGTEGGVFLSANRGTSWAKFHAKNLPTVPVYDIKQHPALGDIVLGTHGRSIWVLDDGGVLGELPDALGKPLHLFPIRDGRPRFRRMYGGLWHDQVFRAENPPLGIIVTYWLSEYRNDDVQIVVLDPKGKEVAKVTGSSAPGFNRVTWDMQPYERLRLPDQGQEPSERFYVQPGTYTVKLTCGDLNAEGQVIIGSA